MASELPEGVRSVLQSTPGIRFVLLNGVLLLLLAYREVSLSALDVDEDLVTAINAAQLPLLLTFIVVVLFEVVRLT